MPTTLAHEKNLLGLTLNEFEQLAVDCGHPSYRGLQIYQGVYARRERDFAGFTDLDAKFREYLSAHYAVHYPRIEREIVSRDRSIRYLLTLEAGEPVDAVYIP